MVDAGARNTTKQSAKNCFVPRKITDKRYSLAIPVYFPPLHPPPLFKQILCRLNRQHPGPVRTLPFSSDVAGAKHQGEEQEEEKKGIVGVLRDKLV